MEWRRWWSLTTTDDANKMTSQIIEGAMTSNLAAWRHRCDVRSPETGNPITRSWRRLAVIWRTGVPWVSDAEQLTRTTNDDFRVATPCTFEWIPTLPNNRQRMPLARAGQCGRLKLLDSIFFYVYVYSPRR